MMQAMLNIATRAARSAGDLIMQAYDQNIMLDINQKEDRSPVTQVDLAAEAIIIKTLQEAYPDHQILSEEAGLVGPESECLWVIDPLDGTTNFVHRLPHFAVSIALRFKGRAEIAVIYNPINGDLFTAIRGQGAQLNGKRLRVSDQRQLRGALVCPDWPHPKRYQIAYSETFIHLQSVVASMRRSGATTLDLAYVAAGYIDALWHARLHSWDIAAGALLVREAGGVVTDIHGGTDYYTTGTILTSNRYLIKELMPMITPLALKDDAQS